MLHLRCTHNLVSRYCITVNVLLGTFYVTLSCLIWAQDLTNGVASLLVPYQ